MQSVPPPVPDHFLTYPLNQVVGILDRSIDVMATRADLHRAGFKDEDIEIMIGAEGLHQLDATGKEHGLFGRLLRFLQGAGDMENGVFARQAGELRQGHTLVGVHVRNNDEKKKAEEVLKSHQGHFINYFGLFTIEGMDA